mmetsp:Transcript_23485/g.23152  ORF Transcript_23485/g.23152 Transcript_23485/m.23152 type:complete len:202 (+) Transcript_23485:359-964(+)
MFDRGLMEFENEEQFAEIPAHKVVLAARSPYFKAKFCRGDWGDCSNQVANLIEFSEKQMKDFLKYLYTGSLKIDISNIMGVLKISSYFMMDELTVACKDFISNGSLNAFDLCILYCEVREDEYDFDDMKSFLCQIIPSKIDTEIICRVLKEIWMDRSSSTLYPLQEAIFEEKKEDNSLEEVKEVKEAEREKDLQEILIGKL